MFAARGARPDTTARMTSAQPITQFRRRMWAWSLLLVALLSMRLPSLVQPAGGDQGLYAYTGQRILAGDVPYVDVWDQKPPGIGALYAVLWLIWPTESMVPAADLAAAAAIAWLLVVIGRRRLTPAIGYGAAAIFLLLGDPYLQRMSGVYVRAQCEPFIALAVAAALALLAHHARGRSHLLLSGACLAGAFWLKYNAATYALPLAVAAWGWGAAARESRAVINDLLWIGTGFVVVTTAVLAWFGAHGALLDLRLATIDYNLHYSNETYQSALSLLVYPFVFPFERARLDILWYLGGLGVALLLTASTRPHRSVLVVLAWLVAAVLSIVVNGQRDLPNYFVQAFPALALAASAGLATLAHGAAWRRYAATGLILAGFWRVGADTQYGGLRLGGLPGLMKNVQFDMAHIRGDVDRTTYLKRFKGPKHDAFENDELVRLVRETTAADDAIYVFGFSGGSVGWKSARVSSSRFFWSHPILIEFAADRPGFGSAGLVTDLEGRPPVLVALQKEEWRSATFFMATPHLRRWLEGGYALERETAMFSVWRRKS